MTVHISAHEVKHFDPIELTLNKMQNKAIHIMK